MEVKWSVVMCCFNSTQRIEQALRCIFAQTFLDYNVLELIIVDNNSTDNLNEFLKSLSIPKNILLKYVLETKPGLSNARKCGALAASGDFICWVDDDNDLSLDYLHNANKILGHFDDVVFLGGRSVWPEGYDPKKLPTLVRRFSKAVAVGDQRQFHAGYIQHGDFLWGAGLCVRGKLIRDLYRSNYEPILTGRLGSTLMSGEDGEITILLQMMGGRGYYSTELLLAHRVDTSRFTVKYFCRLFFGFGLCFPVLRRYKHLVVGATRKTAIGGRKSSNDKRKREESFSFFYIIFAAFFILGAFRGYLSKLRNGCDENVVAVLDFFKKA